MPLLHRFHMLDLPPPSSLPFHSVPLLPLASTPSLSSSLISLMHCPFPIFVHLFLATSLSVCVPRFMAAETGALPSSLPLLYESESVADVELQEPQNLCTSTYSIVGDRFAVSLDPPSLLSLRYLSLLSLPPSPSAPLSIPSYPPSSFPLYDILCDSFPSSPYFPPKFFLSLIQSSTFLQSSKLDHDCSSPLHLSQLLPI